MAEMDDECANCGCRFAIHFRPPSVLLGDACYGDCDRCPGWSRRIGAEKAAEGDPQVEGYPDGMEWWCRDGHKYREDTQHIVCPRDGFPLTRTAIAINDPRLGPRMGS